MYDIDELERTWIRYSRKRFLKRSLLAGGVLLLIAVPIGYVILKPAQSVSAPPTAVMKRPDMPAQKPPVPSSEEAEKKRTLKNEAPLRAVVPVAEKPKAKKPRMMITLSDPGKSSDTEREETPEQKKIRLQMTDAKSVKVVRMIEKRFPMTRDYNDAMYLAKYYYGKRNYRKAEYWAMQANTIDSNREESWIVFGKAKAKRGHRADALRVLQAYYDRSGSMRVQTLIDRIRKGKGY